ncbi:MAG TPA: glycosyltransferase family 87 protein [Polyangiaceae bacterium]|nr:glycosyltransferase family 87 protein [Polyangiaceae bacterium]
MRSQGSLAGRGPSWERFSGLLVLALWGIARAVQVKYLGTGVGFDVGLYQQYAHQFGSGAGAYVDFQPEYPPGALPVFLLPLLWGGAVGYAKAFAAEMACFDLAACLLVFFTSRLGAPRGSVRPWLACGLYIAITAALFPVLYTRFDLVPGTLVLAAIYCFRMRRPGWAGVFLGIAGCVKLWPFALVPLFAAWEIKRKGFRHAVAAGLWVGVGAIVAALPLLPRAELGVFSFLKYHAARGIQLETTWATVALILNRIGIANVQPEHNFGAFHVAGRLPAVFATLSMPLTILFALAPQVVAIVRRLRQGEERERAFEHAAFASVLGFMIAGKVLSPQFMLWIAPLLPLAAEGPAGAFFALMVGALTTAVYPYLSPALEQREPGHGWALLALGGRNLLLIGWYCAFFFRALGPLKLGRWSLARAHRLSAATPSQHGNL